jgi:hypothetical protein
LRGFQRERFLALDLQGDGMEFASEMVVKASLNQLKITEVPTQLYPDGRSRPPHLRPWRDGWRHLRLLLLLCPRWLFLIPGVVFMLLGMTLITALTFGPINISGINFDIHTMLFGSVFVIIGMQAAGFAMFAHTIAEEQLNLPAQDGLIDSVLSYFTLERGLVMGLLLLCGGTAGAGYSFWYWQQQAFGNLVPTDMMRILIPSATAMIIGLQTIFGSFFMSLLGLHYARQK